MKTTLGKIMNGFQTAFGIVTTISILLAGVYGGCYAGLKFIEKIWLPALNGDGWDLFNDKDK